MTTSPPRVQVDYADWKAAGHLGYLFRKSTFVTRFKAWICPDLVASVIDSLPLETLGDVIVGLQWVLGDDFAGWLDLHRYRLIERFRLEAGILAVDDDGETIKCHFVVTSDTQKLIGGDEGLCLRDPLNEAAMSRLRLISRLLPDRTKCASQGYGHRIYAGDLAFDSTTKHVERRYLQPTVAVFPNSTFRALGTKLMRPENWAVYVARVSQLRRDIVGTLSQLDNALRKRFQQRRHGVLFDGTVKTALYEDVLDRLKNPPLLPICAVDEWGFTDETSNLSLSDKANERNDQDDQVIARYRVYNRDFMDYIRCLDNFLTQAPDASIDRKNKQNNILRLSIINLADAIKALPRFQQGFRHCMHTYIDQAEFDIIESNERTLLSNLLVQWQAYLFHAQSRTTTTTSFRSQSNRLVEQTKSRIMTALKRTIDAKLRVGFIDRISAFEGEKALWLYVDGEDAVLVIAAIDGIFTVLRQSVPKTDCTSLVFHLIDLQFQSFVIVPLVRGKSFSRAAWKLPSLPPNGEPIASWHFVQRRIPDAEWEKSGLKQWTLTHVSVAVQLASSVETLAALLFHLLDISTIPGKDELGDKMYHEYVARLQPELTLALDCFLSARDALLDEVAGLRLEDLETRPALQAAVDLVTKLSKSLFSAQDSRNGVCGLPTDTAALDLMIAAEQIGVARGIAVLASLNWLTDILGRGKT